jgi:hypothetical protein
MAIAGRADSAGRHFTVLFWPSPDASAGHWPQIPPISAKRAVGLSEICVVELNYGEAGYDVYTSPCLFPASYTAQPPRHLPAAMKTQSSLSSMPFPLFSLIQRAWSQRDAPAGRRDLAHGQLRGMASDPAVDDMPPVRGRRLARIPR